MDKFAISMEDCARVFRKIPYDSTDVEVQEKWRLIGQCLLRVCGKRCTWWKLEVRASEANVCTFTTVAEEAIVYWLFVTEGEDWVKEFQGDDRRDDNDDGDTMESNSSAQRKKCGKHKTLTYLKHWWQIKTFVEARRQKREISSGWDEAWRLFAEEEIELKRNRRVKRKRTSKDVLPTFEDVMNVGESEGTITSSVVLEEDFQRICRQKTAI